jgi:mRNA interferase YafQ
LLKITYTSQFKSDYKKFKDNKKIKNELRTVINILINEESLPVKYKTHLLKGDKIGCSECHIAPDVLLIYRISEDILILIRMGSHSNLFD